MEDFLFLVLIWRMLEVVMHFQALAFPPASSVIRGDFHDVAYIILR